MKEEGAILNEENQSTMYGETNIYIYKESIVITTSKLILSLTISKKRKEKKYCSYLKSDNIFFVFVKKRQNIYY